MKHLLNDLTEKEKNSIREQHTGGMNVVTENFSKLINAKSGNVKPVVNEDESSNGMIYLEDNGMEFPKDPNQWDKFYIRHFLTSGNFDSVEEANEKFQEIYGNPEFQFSVTFSGPAGSTVILTKGDEKIGGHYPVDFGGGIEADNRDRFSRSDDVFYNQNKRY